MIWKRARNSVYSERRNCERLPALSSGSQAKNGRVTYIVIISGAL